MAKRFANRYIFTKISIKVPLFMKKIKNIVYFIKKCAQNLGKRFVIKITFLFCKKTILLQMQQYFFNRDVKIKARKEGKLPNTNKRGYYNEKVCDLW